MNKVGVKTLMYKINTRKYFRSFVVEARTEHGGVGRKGKIILHFPQKISHRRWHLSWPLADGEVSQG